MPDFPFVLDRFQNDAIRLLDGGRSVLVCAPTGTGKTVIADHMVDEALEAGREIVYTAPIKALSNQKFRDWCKRHGPERIGLVTGDLVIRREAPCRVMTTEILRNMLLTGEPLSGLRHVILDEIHFLDDRERGTVWEEVLIYLPREVQILGLSATLSNLDDFAGWLSSVRGTEVAVVREAHRAVPLELWAFERDEGLVRPEAFDKAHRRLQKTQKAPREMQGRRFDRRGRVGRERGRTGRFERPAGPLPTSHLDVFERLQKGFLPYLYFVFNRANTERFARQLARREPRLLDRDERRRLEAKLQAFGSDEGGDKVLDSEIRSMLERGVAFHHAGVSVRLKALVEELYEEKLVKVLYCTSTFALGINMPARTVVFDALRKYDGSAVNPLTVRQFMQKAGRAGRRGMDDVGYVVLRVDHASWEEDRTLVTRYETGAPEKVHSAFSLSFNSVVNLLSRHTPDQIRELVRKSFLSWRFAEEVRSQLLLADRLERELRREWTLPPKLAVQAAGQAVPPPETLPPPLRKKAKEILKIHRAVEDREDRCWQDFQVRVGFLQSIGYLGQDLSFSAGATVLQYVQISEVFVAELFLAGILDDIEPGLLFGLLCAIVQDFGRGVGVRVGPDAAMRRLMKDGVRILNSTQVRGADRILGLETGFCPELMLFGKGWADGRSLADLLEYLDSPTDVSGDLVGAFRRARDLAGQLLPLWAHDKARSDAIHDLIRSTGRDEVEVVD
jgi:ATP-dependent RNA helicase HelY